MTAPAVTTIKASSKMRYDGTITLGNLTTLGGMLVAGVLAFGAITGRISVVEANAAQQRLEFTSAVVDLKEVAKEQRAELKDLQKSVNAITSDTALIRGRLASNDSLPSRTK